MLAGILTGLALLPSAAAAEVKQYGDTFDAGGSIFFDGSTANTEPEGETVAFTVLVPGRSLTIDVHLDDGTGQDLGIELTLPDGTVVRDGNVLAPSTDRAIKVTAPSTGSYALRIWGRSKSDWLGFRRSSFQGQALLDAPAALPAPAPAPAAVKPAAAAKKVARTRCATKKQRRTRVCKRLRRR
jgi:hypothetical protein